MLWAIHPYHSSCLFYFITATYFVIIFAIALFDFIPSTYFGVIFISINTGDDVAITASAAGAFSLLLPSSINVNSLNISGTSTATVNLLIQTGIVEISKCRNIKM
jgi:hypothetical protein